MDAIPDPLLEPVNTVRLRRLSVLAATSVIVLVLTVLGVLFYNQRKRDDELAAQARATCRYVTFTRQTQTGVVNYLDDLTGELARLSFRPELRAFARQHLATLDALRRRTEPPACAE